MSAEDDPERPDEPDDIEPAEDAEEIPLDGVPPHVRLRNWLVEGARANRWRIAGLLGTVVLLVVLVALIANVELAKLASIEFWLGLPYEDVLTVGFAERSLQAAMPIALAAIGGLYAEKSGVFNIGLEGFMIFGAVNAVAVSWLLAEGSASQPELWLALAVTVLISLVYTAIFAVLTIRYKADQIVAGLAVWFLGLGFGPFTAVVMWNGVSSPPASSISSVAVPSLSEVPVLGHFLFDVLNAPSVLDASPAEIPVLGDLFFDANPLLWLTIAIVIAAYVVLYRTRYGFWIQAAGENPQALDTAGVSVTRVRYAAVLFSGAMAGLAGGMLSIGIGNGFTGTGTTMVDGRGWIAIVAYLFGNYNPILTALASLLFGAAQMLRIQLQTVGVDLPSSLLEQFPYIAVIVVLTLFGSTRVPSSVGESYESEE